MTVLADHVVCVLCGGDGYVSPETAELYGRQHGDTTCPSCNGSGRVPSRPSRITVMDYLMLMPKKGTTKACVLRHRSGGEWYYLRGIPYLWTADPKLAWVFPNHEAAEGTVKRFPQVLGDCEVEDR